MDAAGYLPSKHQLLSMFINGLPMNSVLFVNLYDNVLNSLNDNLALPNIHQLFDHTIRIENNLLRTRLLNPNARPSTATTINPLPASPNNVPPTNTTQTTNTKIICSNCCRPHPINKCFQPGGAMEGK